MSSYNDSDFDEEAENGYVAKGQSMLNELRSCSFQQQHLYQQPLQQQQPQPQLHQQSQQQHLYQQSQQQLQQHFQQPQQQQLPQQHPHHPLQEQGERTPHNKNLEIDLIEEVRGYDCLWNVRSKALKESPKKAEAWRQILAKL